MRPEAAEPSRQRRRRLLIVDDDEIHREAVMRMLGARFDYAEAQTAAEALDALVAGHFDMILLDQRLPDCQGIEFLSMCAESALPVILLTGQMTPSLETAAVRHGARACLQKDQLTAAGLLQNIERALA